jgi:hypothetical protein
VWKPGIRGCESQDGAVRGVASRCAVGVDVDELSTRERGNGSGSSGSGGVEEASSMGNTL